MEGQRSSISGGWRSGGDALGEEGSVLLLLLLLLVPLWLALMSVPAALELLARVTGRSAALGNAAAAAAGESRGGPLLPSAARERHPQREREKAIAYI